MGENGVKAIVFRGCQDNETLRNLTNDQPAITSVVTCLWPATVLAPRLHFLLIFLLLTYIVLGDGNVCDAANDSDEIKNVPWVTKIILFKHRNIVDIISWWMFEQIQVNKRNNTWLIEFVNRHTQKWWKINNTYLERMSRSCGGRNLTIEHKISNNSSIVDQQAPVHSIEPIACDSRSRIKTIDNLWNCLKFNDLVWHLE